MFKMEDVGRRISLMRKNAGLTQMELANRLGISYQAVSNWERGIAMPDISNLGALAGELGVTVDDIVGDRKISSIIEGKPVEEKLTVDEFNAVSPLLPPEKNVELLGRIDGADGDGGKIDLSPLSLTEEDADDLVRKAYGSGNVVVFAILMRTASQALIDELFRDACRDGNVAFAVMMSKRISANVRNEAFKEAVEQGNVPLIAVLNPFRKPKKNDDEEDEDDDEDDED